MSRRVWTICGALCGLVSFGLFIWLAVALAEYQPHVYPPFDPWPVWPSMLEWDR